MSLRDKELGFEELEKVTAGLDISNRGHVGWYSLAYTDQDPIYWFSASDLSAITAVSEKYKHVWSKFTTAQERDAYLMPLIEQEAGQYLHPISEKQ